MVKNTSGGNKSKGLARKQTSDRDHRRATRLSSHPLEKYAVVTQLLGHGMFYARTEDDKQLLGHIRNKFRGRSKRDNVLVKGTLVLVGLREWEHPDYKECDILEVYDNNEIKELRKISTIDIRSLDKYIESGDSSAGCESTNDIEFSNDVCDYTSGLIPEDSADGEEPISTEELVDFDEL
jgi:initiation factor 1A